MRDIPLLAPVVADLLNWRNMQEQDRLALGEAYTENGFIVTNPCGSYIEPRTFSDYYAQILKLAGLQHFTFHALRHTFASRAMEQGMDEKTLSAILGHYSVAFTMDTYAHVLHDHLNQEMGCMEELYNIDRVVPQNLIYPVIVTPTNDGYAMQSVDFPEIQMTMPTVEDGAAMAAGAMRDAVLALQFPPASSDPVNVPLMPGQFLLQLSL